MVLCDTQVSNYKIYLNGSLVGDVVGVIVEDEDTPIGEVMVYERDYRTGERIPSYDENNDWYGYSTLTLKGKVTVEQTEAESSLKITHQHQPEALNGYFTRKYELNGRLNLIMEATGTDAPWFTVPELGPQFADMQWFIRDVRTSISADYTEVDTIIIELRYHGQLADKHSHIPRMCNCEIFVKRPQLTFTRNNSFGNRGLSIEENLDNKTVDIVVASDCPGATPSTTEALDILVGVLRKVSMY